MPPDDTTSLPPRPAIAWTWNQAPRILATLILAGLGTLVLSFIFLCPVLEETREESRCSYFKHPCRAALAEIESVPPQSRTVKWPVVGHILPDTRVIELRIADHKGIPVRAALSGNDFQVVRVFVPRNVDAAVTDGRDDYTLEFMQSYLIKVKAQRRREWITMLAVWFVAWALLAWHFLPRLPVTESKAIPNG